MKTALSETFAFIKRRPAAGPGHMQRSPAMRNVRATEHFSRQQSPDPIRYGDTPARPSRMQIATSLAIAPYKAVMADDFWISILNPTKNAATLSGPSGQFGERLNIHKPPSDAYGSLLPLLAPRDTYASENPFLK